MGRGGRGGGGTSFCPRCLPLLGNQYRRSMFLRSSLGKRIQCMSSSLSLSSCDSIREKTPSAYRVPASWPFADLTTASLTTAWRNHFKSGQPSSPLLGLQHPISDRLGNRAGPLPWSASNLSRAAPTELFRNIRYHPFGIRVIF